MKKYNEIIKFLKKSKIKSSTDRTFFDETVNNMYIEMCNTGEAATKKVFQRVVQRQKRFDTSNGMVKSLDNPSTKDIYDAPDAHLKTHPPCSEEQLIEIIDHNDHLEFMKDVKPCIYPMTMDEHLASIRKTKLARRKRKAAIKKKNGRM